MNCVTVNSSTCSMTSTKIMHVHAYEETCVDIHDQESSVQMHPRTDKDNQVAPCNTHRAVTETEAAINDIENESHRTNRQNHSIHNIDICIDIKQHRQHRAIITQTIVNSRASAQTALHRQKKTSHWQRKQWYGKKRQSRRKRESHHAERDRTDRQSKEGRPSRR